MIQTNNQLHLSSGSPSGDNTTQDLSVVNPMSFGTPMIEAEASVCNITISFGT